MPSIFYEMGLHIVDGNGEPDWTKVRVVAPGMLYRYPVEDVITFNGAVQGAFARPTGLSGVGLRRRRSLGR